MLKPRLPFRLRTDLPTPKGPPTTRCLEYSFNRSPLQSRTDLLLKCSREKIRQTLKLRRKRKPSEDTACWDLYIREEQGARRGTPGFPRRCLRRCGYQELLSIFKSCGELSCWTVVVSVVLTVRIIAHKRSFRDDIPTSTLVPSHCFIFLCLNRVNRRGGGCTEQIS